MENETVDSPDLQEEKVEEATEDTEALEPELSKEDIAALKEKASKVDDLEKKNKQLYERVKKATPSQQESSKEDGLSNKDVLFLAKVDVHEDDLDEVLDWAKFKKVSVAEAYSQLKTTLDVKAQQRRTAETTNTGGSKRGTAKVPGEDLLARAEATGEVPTSDEGMAALFQARLARRTKR